MTAELAALGFVVACWVAVLAFYGYAKERDRRLQVPLGEAPHAARRLRRYIENDLTQVLTMRQRLALMEDHDDQLRRTR